MVIGAEAVQSKYTGTDAKTVFGYEEVENGIVPDARDLTFSLIDLADQYNKASGKGKEELLDQIRELVGTDLDTSWWIINNNDMLRKSLTRENGLWPTVVEEGLVDELHMSVDESETWYVNIYVIVNDNYRVVPYISRASKCGEGGERKARYVKINGKWYQPTSASSPTAETTGMINSLYKVGWEGIREDWKLKDFIEQ